MPVLDAKSHLMLLPRERECRECTVQIAPGGCPCATKRCPLQNGCSALSPQALTRTSGCANQTVLHVPHVNQTGPSSVQARACVKGIMDRNTYLHYFRSVCPVRSSYRSAVQTTNKAALDTMHRHRTEAKERDMLRGMYGEGTKGRFRQGEVMRWMRGSVQGKSSPPGLRGRGSRCNGDGRDEAAAKDGRFKR